MNEHPPASDAIVIVGGGHAGAQLCAALADAGLGARVHLVCEEPELPYQRPPLSKAYLKSVDEAVQSHRAEAWYATAGITLHQGDAAVAIDRARGGCRSWPRRWPTCSRCAARPTRSACANASSRRLASPCSAAASLVLRLRPRRAGSARR